MGKRGPPPSRWPTAEDAQREYAARSHGRDALTDGLPGCVLAVMAELRWFLDRVGIRGARQLTGGRDLPAPPQQLSPWAERTLGRLRERQLELGGGDSAALARLHLLIAPELPELLKRLASRPRPTPNEEATAARKDPAGAAAARYMASLVLDELEPRHVDSPPARDDVVRAFYAGTRVVYRFALGRDPKPAEMLSIALANEIETCVKDDPKSDRRLLRGRWRDRIRRWNPELDADPEHVAALESARRARSM